jgi:hypothetical protein
MDNGWWDQGFRAAKSTLGLIQQHTTRNDPIGRLLVATILFLLCAGFAALLELLLGRHLYDGIFALTEVALCVVFVILCVGALTPYGPKEFRWAARTGLIVVVLSTMVWELVDRYSVAQISLKVRERVEFVRVMLGLQTIGEFLTSLSNKSGTVAMNVQVLPASEPLMKSVRDTNYSPDAWRLLTAMAERPDIKISSSTVLTGAGAESVYAIVGGTVQFEENVNLELGGSDLVIVANYLRIGKNVTFSGFQEHSVDGNLPGSGQRGSPSGNLFLIITGKVEGVLAAKLIGQHGQNGEAGQKGEDVLNPPVGTPGSLIAGMSEVISTDDDQFRTFIEDAKKNNVDSGASPEIVSEIGKRIDACASSKNCLIFRCKTPPSAAQKGNPGGSGQPGGNGGDAGNNGAVIVRSQEDPNSLLKNHVLIAMGPDGKPKVAEGGAIGPAGRGGKGGPPGESGKDDPLKICPRPNPGERGDFGVDGQSSRDRPNGRNGLPQDPRPLELSLRDYFGRPLPGH